MNKFDYVKLACKEGIYTNKPWWMSMFSMIYEEKSDIEKEPRFSRLYRDDEGHYFFNGKEFEKIEDADPKSPLFDTSDVMDIDPDDIPNLSKSVKTTVGNFLANWVMIIYTVGNVIPYINSPRSLRSLGNEIAANLIDDPDQEDNKVPPEGKYYVYQLKKLYKVEGLLTSCSRVLTASATPKNILPPEGIEKYKEKLIKEYGDSLKDPIVYTEFENKLKEFDAEYMKDDPSYNRLVSGKFKNKARTKMFLAFGSETGPDGNPTPPVINSLGEGLPTDPKSIVSLFNSSRAGSYNRGKLTVLGGLAAKITLRSSDNIKVVDGDCGTKVYQERVLRGRYRDKYIGRNIVDKGKVVLLTSDNIDQYAGKKVKLRSAKTCKAPKSTRCEVCMGTGLSKRTRGIPLGITELSGPIISYNMAAMHGRVKRTIKTDLRDALGLYS